MVEIKNLSNEEMVNHIIDLINASFHTFIGDSQNYEDCDLVVDCNMKFSVVKNFQNVICKILDKSVRIEDNVK